MSVSKDLTSIHTLYTQTFIAANSTWLPITILSFFSPFSLLCSIDLDLAI